MYGNLRSVVEKEYGSPSQPSAKAVSGLKPIFLHPADCGRILRRYRQSRQDPLPPRLPLQPLPAHQAMPQIHLFPPHLDPALIPHLSPELSTLPKSLPNVR